MNDASLIQNRTSTREFMDKPVAVSNPEQIIRYSENDVRRPVPDIGEQLRIFGTEDRDALEGAAGYHKFLVGAPRYQVLLSQKHEMAYSGSRSGKEEVFYERFQRKSICKSENAHRGAVSQ